jgi:antitoxin MazE
MRVKLIQIGKSKGVRIPTALLRQAGIEDDVTLRADGRRIILEPVRKKNPREGWEEAIKKAIAEHGNELTQEDREWMGFSNKFDEEEWTW